MITQSKTVLAFIGTRIPKHMESQYRVSSYSANPHSKMLVKTENSVNQITAYVKTSSHELDGEKQWISQRFVMGLGNTLLSIQGAGNKV